MALFARDANNRAGRAGLDRPFRIGIDNSNIWVTQAGGRVTVLHRNGPGPVPRGSSQMTYALPPPVPIYGT
jgi:hypothetical protein